MKAYRAISTWAPIQSDFSDKHAEYIRRDDIPSLLAALKEATEAQARALEDFEQSVREWEESNPWPG